MRTDKYVVSTLQAPERVMSPEFRAMYEQFGRRILWMDSNVVPGAFQMNTSWFFAVPEQDPVFPEHSHPSPEILGFFSGDFENPNELGAEIELTIDGEVHSITKSTMVFVPPNMPHQISFKRFDRPVFHFSVVTDGEYDGAAYTK